MSGAEPIDEDSLGFERLVFFSDAVFAIAITLLVLNLKPADAFVGGAVHWATLAPKLAGFGLSFYVIGRYWLLHHELFEHVRGYDGRLLAINLIFLAAIVFMPFATSVVIDSQTARGPVIFYLVCLSAVAWLMLAVTWTARRPAFLKPGETHAGTIRALIGSAGPSGVFLLAIVIGFFAPHAALWSLLLLIPVGEISARIGQRFEARAISTSP